MSFHPRMLAAIRGFTVMGESSSFSADGMAVDYWHVSNKANAGGHYVSMFPRLVIILDGKKIPLAAQRTGAPLPCAACYVPAGTEVWSRFDRAGDLRHVDIHLSQDRFQSLAGPGHPAQTPAFLQDARDLGTLVNLLADRDKSLLHREKLAECVVLELLHSLQTGVTRRDDTDLIRHLEAFVADNLGRRIDVQELAEVGEASRSQLNRVMQRATGCSPYRWVLLKRIERAQALLAQGCRFADVAMMTGFSDQAHFNRVFKSVTGQVPSLWMNEQNSGVLAQRSKTA
ncbi:MAG: AraC family transcriptional regulator [Alphaproteobacteria bacterium MedPE-SWcel]|nr:MAG: AraC family transcriptional regulator [Alphaproteobacteria bacterium MedPE-SWcel]